MASIVGKNYLDRVALVTEGAQMSKDGLVTFQSSEVPTELVYNFDMKTPAEKTLMEVKVALSAVNDQTKEEVSVDTSGMDIDSICKDNNVNPNDVEIVVSQEAPSKEDADKLAGEATSKGYKVAATYEILLKLFSQGNEIAEITENFGSVTLTLQAGKDYAGYKAAVFQLHNGQVIEHDSISAEEKEIVTEIRRVCPIWTLASIAERFFLHAKRRFLIKYQINGTISQCGRRNNSSCHYFRYFLLWEGQHTGCMSNPSKYDVPQSHMAFSTGIILFPKAVRE